MALLFAPGIRPGLDLPLWLASGLSNLLREGIPNNKNERFFPVANLFQLAML